MIAANETPNLPTPAAYFAWEAQQREKYEYIDGRVYAMSGGSVKPASSVESLLRLALRKVGLKIG